MSSVTNGTISRRAPAPNGAGSLPRPDPIAGRLIAQLLPHSYPQHMDDRATVHARAGIALDQEWNAARSFEMAGPREGVIEIRELLEQQLRFLKRRHIGRALGATVDTVVHRKPLLGFATHPMISTNA